MRILHVVHQYMPEHPVGGTELYTRWLAEASSQRGHDVSIFYRRDVLHQQNVPDSIAAQELISRRVDDFAVTVWSVSTGDLTPQRRFLATFGEATILKAFGKVLGKTQPDVIHVQHLMGLPVSLLKMVQARAIPYIITLHDYWWVCANAQLYTNYSQEICSGPRAYMNCARCVLARAGRAGLWPAVPGIAALLAHRNFQLHRILQGANTLIAPTQFVADWYVAHGARADKVMVIPHGMPIPDEAAIHSDSDDVFSDREGFDRNDSQATPHLRFGYIGGLSVQKGVHILMEAFASLEDQTELWIAGDESAEPDYVATLKAEATSGVNFLGRLSRDQVWYMLREIDILVVPSLWYESFAFVISEAFAVGVPVIASQIGPLADRVKPEKDGLLVPPGDVQALRLAMQRFVQEPDLLSVLRTGIQPMSSMGAYAAEIEDVYLAATA